MTEGVPVAGPPLRARAAALLWLLLVVALVLHNAWVWFGTERRLNTDLLALLPPAEQDPLRAAAAGAMSRTLESQVIVLIGHLDWDVTRAAATAYAAQLAQSAPPLKLRAADAADTGFDFYAQRRWLLLGAADAEFAARASAGQWVERALHALALPLDLRLVPWTQDPFGVFDQWLRERAAASPLRPRDGLLHASDGQIQYAVLPLTVIGSPFAVGVQREAMPALAAAQAAAATHGAKVLAAGALLHAAFASEQAAFEINTIGWGSLAAILLLMWFAFRSLAPLALVLASLAIGCLGAMSVTSLVFSDLHLLTLVFGATLIGVAEDYGIHVAAAMLERDADVSPSALLRELLPGLLLALGTTLAAYAVLGWTPFPGLQQMAVFSMAGLVFSFATVVFWFPPWFARARANRKSVSPRALQLAAAAAGLPRWRSSPMGWLVAAALAGVVLGGIQRSRSNDDIRLLNTAAPALLAAQTEVARILRAPAPAQYFLVRGVDAEQVLEREEALRVRLDAAVDRHLLAGYQAVSAWVPSQRTQQASSATYTELAKPAGALERLAREVGATPEWLRAARTPADAPLEIDDWLAAPDGAPLRHLWLGRVDREFGAVVALQGLHAGNSAAVRGLATQLAGVDYVDRVDEISAVLAHYRQRIGWVLLACLGVAVALLMPRYRGATVRIVAAVALACGLTLSVLAWAGVALNIFHLLALLLVLGMGMDYGIFLHAPSPSPRQHAAARAAVLLSAASTLLSFGLLGLSATPALQSFGLTLMIGISLVVLLASSLAPTSTATRSTR